MKTSAGSDIFRPQKKKRIMRQASGLERPTDVRAAAQRLGRTQRRGHHSRARDTLSPSGQPGTPRHPAVSQGHPVTQRSARDTPSPSGQPGTPRHPVVSQGHPVTQRSARDTPSPSGQPGTPRHPAVSQGHPVTQRSARDTPSPSGQPGRCSYPASYSQGHYN